ncbi:MAG: hypothetical protein WBH40_17230 [Ignavibacteriaceae bacterium]
MLFEFNSIPQLWNEQWVWVITFYFFAVVKAINNALRHDYKSFKSRFGIKDQWDFWFNPGISHRNKYKSPIWKLLTPFSDLWHTLWTLWMTWFQVALLIETGSVIFSFGISGVVGVWLIFNSLYAFARKKKYGF